jgi:arylsulfatase A-like enzyme
MTSSRARGSGEPPPGGAASVVRKVPFGISVADGSLAAVLLALGELVAVALLRSEELAGGYEVGLALSWILPLSLVLAVPAGAVAGALVATAARAEATPWRAATGLAAALFGGLVGYGVSSGRQLEGGLRAPFVAVVAALAATTAWLAAPHLARLLGERAPRRRALAALALLAAVALLELVNATVLVRLYDAFHHGLGALAVLAAACALALAWPAAAERPRGRAARAILALLAFAAGAALAAPAANKLAGADNLRRIYGTQAPLLAHAVTLGAALSPPAPLDEGPAPPRAAAGPSVELAGRDVVLVTVDAVRADHVGAYGYGRGTTPRLDALAKDGVLFEAAYTATPHTSYALTSLMTGKYMRPLLLQGLGLDSETWATHLRRYGFKTAAFYPPAVFFIDAERFAPFASSGFGFEYRRVEFASADTRVAQVEAYLQAAEPDSRLFLWVHLFEPHEPYEAHAAFPFGERDVDRYDGELAAADAGVGGIVDAVRRVRPNALVIVTADHGEEFLDHGGRYHGTTAYEEQVRVPLVFNAPGLLAPRRVTQPVGLVDLLPTVLAGLTIPRPARIRGADLGPYLLGAPLLADSALGFAFAESETQTMLARGPDRLVCERRLGACALYDVVADPAQKRDISAENAPRRDQLRSELRAFEASHGRYEQSGLRSEGKGWPEALRRGISGDADAASDIAGLLDDADVTLRRKAAEVLFELRRPEVSPQLRLALTRDEDEEVRRYSALALTRLGQGAPLARELVGDPDLRWSRLAALALAESGDARGERILLAWFRSAYPGNESDTKPVPLPFERARELAAALGHIRSRTAVGLLIGALDDVRLRPDLARALADIGEDAARPALAEHLANERYHNTRVALFDALVRLGAKPELRAPLVRFLGTPDPLPDGLGIAQRAELLSQVGGPKERDLARLRRFATSGVGVRLLLPEGGNGKGTRILCRVRSTDGRGGELRVGRAKNGLFRQPGDGTTLVPGEAPELDPERETTLQVLAETKPHDVATTLPESLGATPGKLLELVFYATQNVAVDACAVVPLADELPPPPPAPWQPEDASDAGP